MSECGVKYAYVVFSDGGRSQRFIVSVRSIKNFKPVSLLDFDPVKLYQVKWQKSGLEDDGFYDARIVKLGASPAEIKAACQVENLRIPKVLESLPSCHNSAPSSPVNEKLTPLHSPGPSNVVRDRKRTSKAAKTSCGSKGVDSAIASTKGTIPIQSPGGSKVSTIQHTPIKKPPPRHNSSSLSPKSVSKGGNSSDQKLTHTNKSRSSPLKSDGTSLWDVKPQRAPKSREDYISALKRKLAELEAVNDSECESTVGGSKKSSRRRIISNPIDDSDETQSIDSDCSLLDYCEKPKPNSNNQLLTEDSEKSSEDESEKEVEKDKTKNKTSEEKNDGKSDSDPDTEEKNDGRATEQDNENEGSDQEEDDGEWKKTVAAVKNDLCASATAVDKRLKANPNDDQQLYLGYGLHVSKDLWLKKLRGAKKQSAFVNDLTGNLWTEEQRTKRSVTGVSKTRGDISKATPKKVRLIEACVVARCHAKKIMDPEALSMAKKEARETINQKFYETGRPKRPSYRKRKEARQAAAGTGNN